VATHRRPDSTGYEPRVFRSGAEQHHHQFAVGHTLHEIACAQYALQHARDLLTDLVGAGRTERRLQGLEAIELY